ncbi:MAG: triple tyrosine motif-containing protein [Bacteroidales bacterium]
MGTFVHRKGGILLLGLLVVNHTGWRDLSGQAFNPNVRNFEKREYGAGNQNWSIATTSDGLTYFANNDGLLEFDGSNWDLHAMPGNLNVRSVSVDSADRVYVGSFEEFGYWDKNEFGRITYHSLSEQIPDDAFHNDEIWRILLVESRVYFQSFSGIFVYDGSRVTQVEVPGPLVVLLEAGGNLYVHGVNRGLFRIDGMEAHFVAGSEFLASDEIKVVLPRTDGKLLLGAMKNGLFLFDGERIEPFPSPAAAEIRDAEINVGIRVGDHALIGTITSGLFVLDENGRVVDRINEGNFLNNNTVLALHRDRVGNVWMGLDAGISYLQLNSPVRLYRKPTVNIGSTYDARVHQGRLYVGTNKGLYRFRGSRPDSGDPELVEGSVGQVWSLTEIDGRLVCGHANGIFEVRDDGLHLISSVNGGFHFEEISFHEGIRLVLATTYHTPVLLESSNGVIHERNHLQGLLEPIPDFVIDHKQVFWGRHLRKGVVRFRLNPDFTRIEEVDYLTNRFGLPPGSTVAIVDGQVVFATDSLVRTYDSLLDSIRPFDRLNAGLAEYRASQKIIDAGNRTHWFIRNNQIGLFHCETDSVQRLFSVDLDMMNVSLVGQFPNISRLTDSTYLIHLEEGFGILSVPPALNDKMPELYFRNVQAGNERSSEQLTCFPEGNGPGLKWKNHTIRFTFSSSSHNQMAQYRYRLVGLSPEFSDWGRNTGVEYERLRPGKYKFDVQVKDMHGSVSQMKSYPFAINRVWYATAGAGILYAVVLLLGFRAFNRRSKKRLSQKEAEKRERQTLKAQESYTRLLNEKLAAENSLKSIQLANFTQQIAHRNEFLSNLQKDIEKMWGKYGPDAFEKISLRIGQLIKEKNLRKRNGRFLRNISSRPTTTFSNALLEAYGTHTKRSEAVCFAHESFLKRKLPPAQHRSTQRGSPPVPAPKADASDHRREPG